WCVLKIFFRVTVVGAENIPKTDGFIVAPNHRSNWDVPVVACFSSRKLAFMAKEEMFKLWITEKLFKSLNAFPIKRGKGDIGAIKAAIRILQDGHVMLMFPEGTRNKTGEDLPAKPGIAYLAIKGQVPILPVAIKGEYRLFGRIMLQFGKPIYFSEWYDQKANGETLQALSNEVLAQIRAMGEK
ncbi:MAG: 1-acyl-sn-glycerol-3-phosphate acyltransferase, partial [Hyphomonadaceae bacterium]|nr:1-acyl-sn-glycerol-3-phosphate acyltransferase [Clostridia bacterium]